MAVEKQRSYIPPLDTEYNPATETMENIVWNLGTPEHPWNNIYIRNINDEFEETVDVYAMLASYSQIPNDDTRIPGSVITCTGGKPNTLCWKTLDEMAGDPYIGIKGETLRALLDFGNIAVPYAQMDANGEVIDEVYLKKRELTPTYMVDKLGLVPVHRAEADQDGNVFADTYVTQTAFVNALDKKLDASKIDFYIDEEHPQYYPKTSWAAIQYKPIIPELSTIESMISDYFNTHIPIYDVRPEVLDLTNRVVLLESTYITNNDFATDAKAGIVKVSPGNGLKYDAADHIISMALATSSTPGTMYCQPGNGLNLSATGKLYLNKAMKDSLGAVQLGVINTYTKLSSVMDDGQWYIYNGALGSYPSQSWLIKKLAYGSGTTQKFIWAQSCADERLELHSKDNGSTWQAPYATWHE